MFLETAQKMRSERNSGPMPKLIEISDVAEVEFIEPEKLEEIKNFLEELDWDPYLEDPVWQELAQLQVFRDNICECEFPDKKDMAYWHTQVVRVKNRKFDSKLREKIDSEDPQGTIYKTLANLRRTYDSSYGLFKFIPKSISEIGVVIQKTFNLHVNPFVQVEIGDMGRKFRCIDGDIILFSRDGSVSCFSNTLRYTIYRDEDGTLQVEDLSNRLKRKREI